MSNDERNKVSEKINMFFRNYQQRKKESILKHKLAFLDSELNESFINFCTKLIRG